MDLLALITLPHMQFVLQGAVQNVILSPSVIRLIQGVIDVVTQSSKMHEYKRMNTFFPSVFKFQFFSTKGVFSPDPLSFSHVTFQNLGYVIKRTAEFRVCHPCVLG